MAVAGLMMGSGIWPFKLMRKYQFEHWFLIAMTTGLIIFPWTIILIDCPDTPHIFRSLWATNRNDLILSNLLAIGWGAANTMCALCFVRIGVALTGAILTGIGATVGVLTPFLLKSAGMGNFKNAPDLLTPAGKWVLAGMAIMLLGVTMASLAGFGRDRVLKEQQKTQGSFLTGLIMAIVAGVLSAGLALAFVYSNGPVVDAMKSHGASGFVSSLAVWPIGAMGGVLVNILYPIFLLAKNKSWSVFCSSWKELFLASAIGANMILSMSLQGYGMRMVGVLGAVVGIGIQQTAQILGGQGVGFISGEWRKVNGKPRLQMYSAILLLLIAALAMAYGNQALKHG